MPRKYMMMQEDFDDIHMVHDALARINRGIANERVYYVLGFHWGRLQKVINEPAVNVVFQRVLKSDAETANIAILTLISKLPRAKE